MKPESDRAKELADAVVDRGGVDWDRELDSAADEAERAIVGQFRLLDRIARAHGDPPTVPQQLGDFEIRRELGRGGMGVVYLARQISLDRPVALKMLPEESSGDPTHLRRFEREAKTLAALGHPNIVTVHTVESIDDHRFITMEFIEGRPLSDCLPRRGLRLRSFFDWAVPLADALDAAHQRGITHRDLKPANVMVTPSGRPKILDFGLAKRQREDRLPAPLCDAERAASDKDSVTRGGAALGTVPYMAPEQVEGKSADHRSDIFSLGIIFFEMLTGRRPFRADGTAETMSAIVEQEVRPLRELRPEIPPALERLVLQCLAKDPRERWQSAGDLRRELEWIDGTNHGSVVATGRSFASRWREVVAWGAVAALLMILLVVVGLRWGVSSQPARPTHTSVNPPPGSTLISVGVTAGPVAVSPDGRHLAFVARRGGQNLLWVRSLDQPSARSVWGTEGATNPFWSADSRFIGFFADQKIQRVDRTGGPPLVLGDAPDGCGGAWNHEGTILFGSGFDRGLFRIDAGGGQPVPVTRIRPELGEVVHGFPEFLPDNRSFLFLVRHEDAGTEVRIGSLDATDSRLLLEGTSNAAFASGHLLYVRDSTLLAQPFDPDRLEVTEEPRPILGDTVRVDLQVARAIFDVSETGILAYQTGRGAFDSQILVHDRSGVRLASIGEPQPHFDWALSPDGGKLATTILDRPTGQSDIWIVELARGTRRRLISEPGFHLAPVWSPEGDRIAYAVKRDDRYHLYIRTADGLGEAEPLHQSRAIVPTDWSRDGRYLFYTEYSANHGLDLKALDLSDPSSPIQLVQTRFDEGWAKLSPDGRWFAYESNESGAPEVYVQSFTGAAGKWRVSNGGGGGPLWSADGATLFYLATDGMLSAAQVDATGDRFEVSGIERLFPAAPALGWSFGLGFRFEAAADGERFLISSLVDEERLTPIHLVQDWTAALQR